ncbi:MAG: tRNA-dihydrouridine synthase family protein [Reichenbachiella sp.]
MSYSLLSSPLQGFTDATFRNAQKKFFGGIDTYYAPYIRFNKQLVIKGSYQRDLNPEANTTLEVIPQVMTADADQFLFAIEYIQSLGYKELNWNLGCPYPMVTKSGMGSGLIGNIEKIDHILDRAHSETDVTISMKMRLGYENSSEILDAFPILEKYPLKNIAIHARLGKQLYKGGVDLEAFQKCVDVAKHTLYYNGDITTVAQFEKIRERFPTIEHFMIGRGLIADPFLPSMIKAGTTEYPADRWDIFRDFHDTIFQRYDAMLSGPTPIKMKMRGFWEFFSQSTHNPQKVFKAIKKAGSPYKYRQAVSDIIEAQKQHTTG